MKKATRKRKHKNIGNSIFFHVKKARISDAGAHGSSIQIFTEIVSMLNKQTYQAMLGACAPFKPSLRDGKRNVGRLAS